MSPEKRLAAVREFSVVYRKHFMRDQAELEETEMGRLEHDVFLALGDAADGLSGPQLADQLRLDKAQLSRFIRSFRLRYYITTERAAWDRRIKIHRLTKFGRDAHAAMAAEANDGIVPALRRLAEGEQEQLVAALATASRLLQARTPAFESLVLREAGPTDYAWVIERHATLYHREHRYSEKFEAFVARDVAHFVEHHHAHRERAFIIEWAGRRAGSAFVVRESNRVARLRFVLVDPEARGHGLGGSLIRAAIDFARAAGYVRMVLTTHSHLAAAIALYRGAGFRCAGRKRIAGFGRPLVAEDWSRDLTTPAT